MAENTRPPSSSQPTMSTKQRRSSRQPMANLEDSTNRTQLISPPPEETLNHLRRVSRTGLSTPNESTSKRKRNTTHGTSQPTEPLQVETTPNPKPRKQLKNRNSTLESPTKSSHKTPTQAHILHFKSPHAENPDADWLPPIPSSATRRSTISARARRTTPIPAYEPPADVFTPPREVIMPPTISKSSKRKSVNRRRTSVTPCLTVTIKKEPPQIDLTTPMPPGSPTDDPLLLSGPLASDMSTPMRRRTRTLLSFAPQSPLPPSSPEDDDDEMDQITERFDWTRHTVPEGSTDAMSMMEVDEQDIDVPPIPLFDLNYDGPANNSAGWDSSDDDEDDELPGVDGALFEQGEGEFTGRWRQTRIPTKADPPSSATRERMEDWGRPITPFPREGIRRLSLVKEAPAEDDAESAEEMESPVQQENLSPRLVDGARQEQDEEEQEEEEVRELSMSLDDEDEEQPEDPRNKAVAPVSAAVDPRFNFNLSFEEEEPQAEPTRSRDPSPVVAPPAVDARFNFEQSFEEDSGEAEMPDMVHDELSLPHDDGPPVEDASLSTTLAVEELPAMAKLPENMDDSLEEEEDEEEEEREVREMSVDFRGEDEEEVLDDHPETHSILDGLDAVPAPFLARQSRSPAPRHISPAPAPSFTRQSSSPAPRHISPAPATFQPESPRVQVYEEESGVSTERPPPRPVSESPLRPSGLTQEADTVVVDADELEDEAEAEADGGSSDFEEDSYDFGIVKITSNDPRAAARAAAILKQHDYDCFTKIMMKQRRQSFATGKIPGRRNSVIGGGIVKQRTISELEKLKNRRATMGVIGETAYIPGSPAKTLPQLLKEAEAEVSMMQSPRISQPSLPEERNPFETPFAGRRASTSFQTTTPVHIQARFNDNGQREWTKEEWKLLDACFTDERLEVGGGDELSSVDEVQLNNVVTRFINLIGGEVVYTYGDGWDRDSLLQRVGTLQAKQRAGKVAPPTTPWSTCRSEEGRMPASGLPTMTPLSRTSRPAINQLPFPAPAQDGGMFAHLSTETVEDSTRKTMPLSLLAPRYSHLFQEAKEVSRVDEEDADQSIIEKDFDDSADDSPYEAVGQEGVIFGGDGNSEEGPQSQKGVGKRVKGFLTSYLPLLKNSSRPSKSTAQPRPSLPLPPSDALCSLRGPITTPVRPEQPRPKHPKDIVHLQPAPPVQKNPVLKDTQPKRLVDLHHVPLPEPPVVSGAPRPRPRTSSGASVKDLVKTFEAKDKEVREEKSKRPVALNGRRTISSKKPGWRP